MIRSLLARTRETMSDRAEKLTEPIGELVSCRVTAEGNVHVVAELDSGETIDETIETAHPDDLLTDDELRETIEAMVGQPVYDRTWEDGEGLELTGLNVHYYG